MSTLHTDPKSLGGSPLIPRLLHALWRPVVEMRETIAMAQRMRAEMRLRYPHLDI